MLAAPAVPGVSQADWGQRLFAALAAPSGPLAPVQQRGLTSLAQRSMPGRRDEAWRFTDLAALTALDPAGLLAAPADHAGGAALPSPAPGSLRLRLDAPGDPLAGVALPEGLSRLSDSEVQEQLGQVLEANGCRDHWPVLLNKAAASRVLALRVRGAVAPTLELVSDAGSAPALLPIRLLLHLEEGASLTLLQVHRSGGANLTSVVLEARLEAGARLAHSLIAEGHGESVLLAHLALSQEPGSQLSCTTASAGWGLIRLEPHLLQPHGGASSELGGLQLVRERQLADTHSRVEFLGPEGRLDQLHKVVADDAGRSVFNGAVRVPRPAQRTDAAQLSRSLLLSDRARVDTKPEMEIVADDVRCAHGATVSRLRDDELFYLQSRGISADQAATLLLRGYCQEILDRLPPAAAVWQPLQTLLGERAER
jgi:Fe-S cluster assembly protein SufD